MSDPTVAAPLLRTKLHAPSRRRGAVDRPRLAVRAPTGERRRLTLVSAPAGFGKTTLLSEWYAGGAGSGTAWLSLDGRDNDPGTFWTYVIAALRTVVPDVGAAALAILETSNGPTDAAVESLVGDLNALDADVVLVLDDYHVIDTAEITTPSGFLIDHLPPSVGLVLATQVDPPLPLARLGRAGISSNVGLRTCASRPTRRPATSTPRWASRSASTVKHSGPHRGLDRGAPARSALVAGPRRRRGIHRELHR